MDAVMTRLLDSRLDFDLIDDRGLQTCRVINGRIQASYEDFDLLVLFDTGDFLPETLAALRGWRRQAAACFVYGKERPFHRRSAFWRNSMQTGYALLHRKML